jgi:ribonucleoside-diphosphate reductase alpha chain
MDVASAAVGEVEQGGSRRGAAMFMLNDWHPDLFRFIEAKCDLQRLTNANVSVAISNRFMAALEADDDWTFEFPDTTDVHYDGEWEGDLEDWVDRGYPVVDYASVPARVIWERLAAAAWASGEPGVVFLDRYNEMSTAAESERIICVNPCGEQGLGAYGVCNLGAMNLDAYVEDNGTEVIVLGKGRTFERDGTRGFNYDRFMTDVAMAVRFLDRVIDCSHYFIPENFKSQMSYRRIGLGVMGLADALIGLGHVYGSPEAVRFTETVFRVMRDVAIETSVGLAHEKGRAAEWDPDMVARPFLKDYMRLYPDKREALATHGLRNIFLLTQAPTGTTSILAGVNSGIEPLFAFRYRREDRTGVTMVEAPAVAKYSDGRHGPERSPEFITAGELTVKDHIAMQAAVQKYVDTSVSKTINGPNQQSVADVEDAFLQAWEAGLKGLAYFRDGSGRKQVLSHEEPDKDEETAHLREQLENALGELMDATVEWERPIALKGETRKVYTAAGTAFVTVNRDEDGQAREVFFHVGKAGQDVMELGEAMGRLASLALRHGATLGGVANQLEGIGGLNAFNIPLAAGLGEALTEMNKDGHVESPPEVLPIPEERKPVRVKPDLCPQCGLLSLIRQEGCAKCYCGYSAC